MERIMKKWFSFDNFPSQQVAGFPLVAQLTGAQFSNFEARKLSQYSCRRSEFSATVAVAALGPLTQLRS